MPIFMDAKTVGVMRAQEDEDTQRQAPTVSRQIGNDAVAEQFAGKVFPAAEEHEQANNVDR